MKLIVSLVILIASISCKSLAQTQGSYITNNTMSAFHGNWQWVSGTDTVRIHFATRPVVYNINGGFTWDKLVGWYYYKKGNQTVYSNYNSIGNTTLNTIIKGGNEADGATKVGAFFKDPLKDRTNEVTLTLNGAQNQITWRANEIGLIRSTGTVPTPGMTLPANMVLMKL